MSTFERRSGAPEALPSLAAFSERFDNGTAQVVYTRLVADLETPVSAYLKLAGKPGTIGFLLESVEGGAQRGRYSIIGLEPDLIWRAHGDAAEINRTAQTDIETFTPEDKPTLEALRSLLAESSISLPDELPPMAAGVFGYMGYDTVRLIERLPDEPQDDLGVPDALFVRPTIMVIFDNVRDEMTLVTPVRPEGRDNAAAAYKAACSRLEKVVSALEAPLAHETASIERELAAPDPVSNTSSAEYLDMVARAKEYIVAGDIFQVVLSQRFSAPFDLPSFALYRVLRRLNPSPFLFHLDFGDFSLVGSSPEILVRVRDGEVTIRPIAGTRRRGETSTEDAHLEADLLADPKERAEHLMLLDLGRNDVGRVAEVGTVNVTAQFVIERYSHVMHIVSNVVGRLDSKTHDAVDALMAGFPAGTVSGAPKVRAMEIIDELEKSKRGPYAGCVGYFSADGNMDTCIVLRTALVKDGMLHVQAGAGIVHDSVPESEQQECVNKAKAIVRAAEVAVRFASGTARSAPEASSSNGGLFG
ncbi:MULTISPECIES: anthranilate synthase component I [Filomicrobium]|uniref:Anthranilate synthase component 1 n=1 Tax=Filomicrobium insigne TaxID=418854 RepID=A0A1H0R7R0_9HYPH|nr:MULTISPECIES: anthranilate synthase component I [Filomicrobium]MCV0369367.1 anthranilate synthase component I [Filomicrobium sp.]SDP25563.1 anthranilate synthase component 1 [Filomicrobium insigne]